MMSAVNMARNGPMWRLIVAVNMAPNGPMWRLTVAVNMARNGPLQRLTATRVAAYSYCYRPEVMMTVIQHMVEYAVE